MAVTVRPGAVDPGGARAAGASQHRRADRGQGERPVGILSERDIVREAAHNESFFLRTVADLMTRDVDRASPRMILLTVATR